MLKENWLLSTFDLRIFALDAVEGKVVSIYSDDLMTFNGIVEVLTVFHGVEFGFRVLFAFEFRCTHCKKQEGQKNNLGHFECKLDNNNILL